MYYHDHDFKQPEDQDVKVWRYMDLTKFLSLLTTKSLFFNRADKFEDPFEGTLPNGSLDAWRKELLGVFPDQDSYKRKIEETATFYRSTREAVAISCWHMNPHESAAMWKLYLKSGEGIAVQSTYKKLCDSIIDFRDVRVGLVEYVDFDTFDADINIPTTPFRYKRKSFEHEREVRALFYLHGHNMRKVDRGIHNGALPPFSYGVPIEVDLDILVENIVLAPGTPQWLHDLIVSLIAKLGFDFKTITSRLDDRPAFEP